jgi:Response regulators consisting of a CheY-like receiver domain and a winged-helix DNA-binding domain
MPKKILIVEDSKNIALIIRMCLEKHGYQVISAGDGVSAVEAVYGSQPDLILLDVLIPKLNGYLVAEAIKQDIAVKHISVIMMSAKAQAEDINKALAIGAEDYLIKPFTPEELIDKIKQYLLEG